MYCAVLVEGVANVLPECGHFGLGYGVEGGAECAYSLFKRCACGWQVGAHPCLDGAVVSQNKDSTIRVVLLGREGVCEWLCAGTYQGRVGVSVPHVPLVSRSV